MKIALFGAGYVAKMFSHSYSSEYIAITKSTPHVEQYPTYPIDTYGYKGITPYLNECSGILIGVSPSNSSYEDTYIGVAKYISSIQFTNHIVYLSSVGVYPKQSIEPLTESTPLIAKDPNSAALIEAESILQSSYPNQLSILRLGGIYGPNRELFSQIPEILPGTGEELLYRSHIALIIKMITFCFTTRYCGIINVIEEGVKRRDFYTKLAREKNLPPPRFDPHLPLKHGGNRILSREKLQTILNSLADLK